MSPRSLRRAAERKALKLARKAQNTDLQISGTAAVEPAADASPRIGFGVSEAQLLANRANAQLSTGAKTPEGKATSCLNAVTTGLTGRTVLLHTDDALEYQRHIAAYEKELAPVGPRECDLVQSIADTVWRLRRIPGLEFAIFAHGYVEFAEKFKDHDPALRPGMIELQTFLHYEKQLRNLQLQEARLSRRREKETAELRELQQAREKQATEVQEAGTARPAQTNGFEFSTAEIQPYFEGVPPAAMDSMTNVAQALALHAL
jgi:hypothetical protein